MILKLTAQDPRDYLEYRFAPGNTVEIVDIKVRSARRTGIGRSMVDRLIALIQVRPVVIYAITRNSNRIARQFYAAIGFRQIGTLDHFYPLADEDGVIYGRHLCE